MTPQEIINLLSIAASFDNRKPGEATVHAWGDSAQRARWTYAEAAEAIKNYYATTTDDKPWVMPSHITAFIRDTRQDREMRATADELIALAAAPDPRVLALVESHAAKFEIPAQFQPSSRIPALQVECSHCGAREGEPCVRPSRLGPQRRDPHPTRVSAAEEPA